MDLLQIVVKALLNRAKDSAVDKIGEMANRRREKKNQDPDDIQSASSEEGTVTPPLSPLDKAIKYKWILPILFIVSLIGASSIYKNIQKYGPIRQKVDDYVVNQYGTPGLQKNDYVKMTVVRAEPATSFFSKYNSTTTTYNISLVFDEEDRIALYCETNSGDLAYMMSKLGYSHPTIYPYEIVGKLTNIKDEFSSYTGYSNAVIPEMEQIDMIIERTPPDGIYEMVQTDENRQKEQTWKTIQDIIQIIGFICLLMYFVLSIVRIVKNARNKKEENTITE